MDEVRLYENKEVRSVWDEEQEEWYFSVVDVVGVLSESKNPTDYLKKMRKRDEQLALYIGTNCPQVAMKSSNGKKRKILAGNMKDILRIIQSIPSPKAEPFKQWLAQVGKERIDETIDPELTIDRALETYLKKGYTREWIHQRLQAIHVRKELTDAWDDHGVEKGIEYAILTDEITKAWSGMTTRGYKNLKGLKKENLRDNMTTLEIVLNMLAEATTTELTKIANPQGLEENRKVAKEGGSVAGNARKEIEQRSGRSVVTPKNAATMSKLIGNIVKEPIHEKTAIKNKEEKGRYNN
jgi:prophage antirepressor